MQRATECAWALDRIDRNERGIERAATVLDMIRLYTPLLLYSLIQT